MDRGGCQMSGGGGGGGDGDGDGAGQGMITLEDLESFSEELTDSDMGSLGGGGGNTGEEDDERLLHYWQDAARGHQVEVPQDMAEPIQQLTSNNAGRSDREKIPFTLISRKEKCDEVLYEKRLYEKANWACIMLQEETYEQSICYGFMRLMRYICQQNSTGDYLGMTIPILTVIRTDQDHTVLSRGVTVAYYLPLLHQATPPRPQDPDIVIEAWPATMVYAREFPGATNEVTLLQEVTSLAALLPSPPTYVNDSFIVAGYTNPAHPNRKNEIWFMERI